MPEWTQPRLPPDIPGGGPTLIGRAEQLARFEAIWAAVMDGNRQVVLVGGEPGIGKTRLAAEVATTVHAHGAAVLWGRSTAELDVPYGPFAVALDRLLAGGPAGAMAPVLGDAAPWLLRLTPQVNRHRPDLGEPTATERDQRLPMFDAVLDLLLAMAARRPVVVVLEDLQWATAPTRDLLVHLVQSTARAHLLFVVTHRTTAPDRNDDLTYVMADLYRHDGVTRIDLSGLATEDVADYLVREAGMPKARALPSAAVLRDQTGGNPFFIRELWRDLAAEGGIEVLRSTTFRAPASVRDTLARRLGGLPAAHAEVIELAAVAGGSVDLAILLDADTHPRDVTLAAVDTGVGAGLLTPEEGSPGHYRFPHALARQAVLDRLPPSRSARHHVTIARALERRGAQTAEVLAQLAHHYDRGQALGYADEAVHYLARAADHATRSVAHDEAARLRSRAADIAAATGQARDDLRFAAARSWMLSGDFGHARQLYERLADSTDPDDRLRAAIGFEEASWRPSLPGDRAVELLAGALRRRPSDAEDALYVHALANLGRALSFTGDGARATAVGERALELARRIDDDELVAHALRGTLWRGMTAELAPVLLERAVELSALGTALADDEHLGPAAFFRSVLGYLQGLPDEWMAGDEDLARASRTGGQPFYRYMAACCRYARQYVRGDLAAAAATVETLDELGAEFGPDATDGSFGVQSFMLHRVTGAVDAVRPLVDASARAEEHWAPGLLALYTALDMREPAARVLRFLLADLDAYRQVPSQWAGVLAFMVEATVYLDDVAAAARLRPLLAEYGRRNLVAGQFVAVFGSADRYLAMLDSVLGADTADDHFERAIEMDRRMGAVLHEVETLTAWSRHAARKADPDSATHATLLHAEAHVLAERIGHRAALRALGTTATAVSDATSRPLPDGLTEREVDVLQLIAGGLSNREIGDRLFISPNTAANHVRSILMKIGAPNRTLAAIYAVEHELLEGAAQASPTSR